MSRGSEAHAHNLRKVPQQSRERIYTPMKKILAFLVVLPLAFWQGRNVLENNFETVLRTWYSLTAPTIGDFPESRQILANVKSLVGETLELTGSLTMSQAGFMSTDYCGGFGACCHMRGTVLVLGFGEGVKIRLDFGLLKEKGYEIPSCSMNECGGEIECSGVEAGASYLVRGILRERAANRYTPEYLIQVLSFRSIEDTSSLF